MNTPFSTRLRGQAAPCLVLLFSMAVPGAMGAIPPAQQAYFKPSNTGGGDAFGWAIALSGDTMVVGAPNEDSASPGVNGDQADNSAPDSGAAYVFVRDGLNWVQQAYLKGAHPGARDQFGCSVAIEGDTVVVGACEEGAHPGAGAAYVFVRQGSTWSQQARLQPPPSTPARFFGWSVAISGDTIVVGAPAESGGGATGSGAAYVYARTATTWSHQAYLKAAHPGSGDNFGFAVALSANTLVVGAPGEDSSAAGVDADPTDNSGFNTGAAYIFERTAAEWGQRAFLKSSNAGDGDQFGASVAASGGTVAVGALGEDSHATGVNGNLHNNNSPNSGAAYVFVLGRAGWTEQARIKASNTGVGDAFGVVALSGDTLVVGAPAEDGHATGVNGNQDDDGAAGAGAAYVFTRTGGDWIQQAYLKASNTGTGDQFGAAVAVAGDTVTIGAHAEDSGATGVNGNQADNTTPNPGAAYAFIGLGLPIDGDGDGVPDSNDQCPGTFPGAVTDAHGCSLDQLVPCDGPWRNHGEFLRALRSVADHFVREGLLTEDQRRALLKQGATSDCGKR